MAATEGLYDTAQDEAKVPEWTSLSDALRVPGAWRVGPLRPAAVAGADLAETRLDLPRGRRIVDVLLASAGLTAAAPVLLVAAVAIKLEDRGPLLFRQRRLGSGRQPFTVLKLRTMVPQASSEVHERYIAQLAQQPATSASSEQLCKLTDDARVTRVGRWLRRLSLDEVPQLVNVLAGHMSVVGPRPALSYEVAFYEPHHFERFAVRPGLTGLWQVSGRNRLGFLQMLDLDVEYVRRRSALLDLAILLLTPPALVRDNA